MVKFMSDMQRVSRYHNRFPITLPMEIVVRDIKLQELKQSFSAGSSEVQTSLLTSETVAHIMANIIGCDLSHRLAIIIDSQRVFHNLIKATASKT